MSFYQQSSSFWRILSSSVGAMKNGRLGSVCDYKSTWLGVALQYWGYYLTVAWSDWSGAGLPIQAVPKCAPLDACGHQVVSRSTDGGASEFGASMSLSGVGLGRHWPWTCACINWWKRTCVPLSVLLFFGIKSSSFCVVQFRLLMQNLTCPFDDTIPFLVVCIVVLFQFCCTCCTSRSLVV